MHRLLDGLSWSALGLVAAFCALAALEVVLSPGAGIVGSGGADLAFAWLTRFPVFLVSGVTMLVTAVVVLNAAGARTGPKAGVAVLAALVACALAALARYGIGATPLGEGPGFMITAFVSWFLPGAALVTGYVFHLHTRADTEQANTADLRRSALEKQRLETRLRLLQAQIEPHFLFNTLSNVRRLCHNDAAAGRAMLGQLARYLRAALPRMRGDDVSLGEEMELVSAYLGLQKVRMGDRLQTSVDAPATLADARVPSMMLATLVENAVKHGIAPAADGGEIRIAAIRHGERLRLTVADTGVGFSASSGSGVGLTNIRARLAALHGERASLRIEANRPRGVVASVELPFERRGA